MAGVSAFVGAGLGPGRGSAVSSRECLATCSPDSFRTLDFRSVYSLSDIRPSSSNLLRRSNCESLSLIKSARSGVANSYSSCPVAILSLQHKRGYREKSAPTDWPPSG